MTRQEIIENGTLGKRIDVLMDVIKEYCIHKLETFLVGNFERLDWTIRSGLGFNKCYPEESTRCDVEEILSDTAEEEIALYRPLVMTEGESKTGKEIRIKAYQIAKKVYDEKGNVCGYKEVATAYEKIN